MVLGWVAPTSTLPILGYKIYMNDADNKLPSILAYDGSSLSNVFQA